jgi:hypothetical protein
VPAEQRLLRTNGRLQKALNALQCAPESEQSLMAHRTLNSACLVHHRTVRWPRRQKLQRSESNGQVTWQAHRTVRCATGQCPVHQERNSELLTFRNSGGRSAIIHRTVRCAGGATANSRQRSSAKGIKCATVRARVRAEPDGAPDSKQCMSGAPPDYPMAQKIEAPTVRIQRFGDVASETDSVRCPVHHATAAFTKRLVWWLGL